MTDTEKKPSTGKVVGGLVLMVVCFAPVVALILVILAMLIG